MYLTFFRSNTHYTYPKVYVSRYTKYTSTYLKGFLNNHPYINKSMRITHLFLTCNVLIVFGLLCLTSSTQAQIKLKDAEGKVRFTITVDGKIFFENMENAQARMEEYGENGKDGQNVRFYGEEGQVVAEFIAKENTLMSPKKEKMAQLTPKGIKDYKSGKVLSFASTGDLLVDGEKKDLFLDPKDELFKDRVLMVLYLALMGVEVEEE